MLIEIKGWKKLTKNKTLSDLNKQLIEIKKNIGNNICGIIKLILIF